jgi:acyl carrier protein
MKPTKDEIVDVVFASIDELNELLQEHQKLQKALSTSILKGGGHLDSLAFVNFISLIEKKYYDRFGQEIVLTHPDLIQGNKDPFESIGSMVDYIESLSQ